MAWHCNGTTNQEMVAKLKEAGILTTDRAEVAMLTVDRAKYCQEPDPYLDRPRRIGYNVTISAPHMHAYALSILSDQLFDGAKALDVGSGSGYLSACMAYMIGTRGHVVGIEHIPELIELSTRNVREDNPHFLKEGRIKFVVGDGRLGYAADGPYHAIHVGAAAETLPQTLIDQLAPGGRLICPVVAIEGFQRFQDLLQVDKNTDGTITKKKLMQVSYVPLTDPTTQLLMSSVDRGNYTDPSHAYVDAPQGIGYGVTISAPHMHAYALELLEEKLRNGKRALDVGSGSGYLTACMALMMEDPQGLAIGIEHIPELRTMAEKNIRRDHPELLIEGRVELVVGDGRLGYSSHGPYDAIHVGAAAEETPQSLIDQLALGGRLVVPIGPESSGQTLVQIDKTLDGTIKKRSLVGVAFVPLTDKERQYRRS